MVNYGYVTEIRRTVLTGDWNVLINFTIKTSIYQINEQQLGK